jgi:type IV fimbrial biogenesis protein FimT
MERQRGYTLTELVFAMAIVAGLLGWAVPGLQDLRRDAERTREVNQFLHAVHYARLEAVKRNGVVSLCPSGDGEFCAPRGGAWQLGWIVFVNADTDAPAVRDPGEPLLRAFPAWSSGRLTANRSTLSFRPFGQSGVTATFTFCDARGPAAARAVIISQSGRPRVASLGPTNQPLDCSDG